MRMYLKSLSQEETAGKKKRTRYGPFLEISIIGLGPDTAQA